MQVQNQNSQTIIFIDRNVRDMNVSRTRIFLCTSRARQLMQQSWKNCQWISKRRGINYEWLHSEGGSASFQFYRQHLTHLTPSSLDRMVSSSLHKGTFDQTSTSPPAYMREGEQLSVTLTMVRRNIFGFLIEDHSVTLAFHIGPTTYFQSLYGFLPWAMYVEGSVIRWQIYFRGEINSWCI